MTSMMQYEHDVQPRARREAEQVANHACCGRRMRLPRPSLLPRAPPQLQRSHTAAEVAVTSESARFQGAPVCTCTQQVGITRLQEHSIGLVHVHNLISSIVSIKSKAEHFALGHTHRAYTRAHAAAGCAVASASRSFLPTISILDVSISKRRRATRSSRKSVPLLGLRRGICTKRGRNAKQRPRGNYGQSQPEPA
jgi:hypothetical protein